MDPIEPVEGSTEERPPSAEASSSRPTPAPSRPRAPSNRARRPSIRLSRLPSLSSLDTVTTHEQQPVLSDSQPGPSLTRQVSVRSPVQEEDESWQSGRRRSNSEPRPGRWSSAQQPVLARVATPMGCLTEESSHQSPMPLSPEEELSTQRTGEDQLQPPPPALARPASRNVLRRTSQAALNRFSRNRASTVSGGPPTFEASKAQPVNEYGSHVVDVLDVIDPEVSALSTLTNVQNSLFIPNLGGFINRMPTYQLSRAPPSDEEQATSADEAESLEERQREDRPALEHLRPFSSMSSVLQGPRYVVLPEGHELEGWTKDDFAELNDHVRHMLHSRRSKFKRSMRGFGQYVRRPLGFLVTLYATLITLFGLAWVLFLIGWINVGGRQLYVINVIDNVLVALFAIMGDGLAPFRAVDTYHMIFIAHYTMLTWKTREKRKLPELKDKNDLPTQHEKDAEVDFADTPKEEEPEYSVLDARQQERLLHHQGKFAKSHTFYKPHETVTHHAFPLRILIAIVVLLDCHSLLQIALGACTWSMETPGERPFALTTVILCCSITCNISGGVLIMIGDRRTRKKDVVERLFRQELTEEAMKKMEKRKIKEERKSMQLEREERKSTQIDREGRKSTQIDREGRKSAQLERASMKADRPVVEPESPQHERPDPFNST
ncbi:integral membrane protein [Penicillium brasilianum]|uniref:Integral membrane protein n=1 Tax=Penicillium brasilianum TaxID=104259 RepID=A0A1S9S093_PENBI|nr:integral membrane protein [Penicillium brasilianum]